MVDLALHIEHRHPGGFGDGIQVAVAYAPFDMPDGDTVEVAAKDLADLALGVAVGDLGGLGFDKGRVPPELSHPSLE